MRQVVPTAGGGGRKEPSVPTAARRETPASLARAGTCVRYQLPLRSVDLGYSTERGGAADGPPTTSPHIAGEYQRLMPSVADVNTTPELAMANKSSGHNGHQREKLRWNCAKHTRNISWLRMTTWG